MMKYSETAYKTLAERFNNMSFLQKIIVVKQQPEIFILEVDDCSNFFLRLNDEDAMNQGIDLLFEFPQDFSAQSFKTIFDLGGISLKIV